MLLCLFLSFLLYYPLMSSIISIPFEFYSHRPYISTVKVDNEEAIDISSPFSYAPSILTRKYQSSKQLYTTDLEIRGKKYKAYEYQEKNLNLIDKLRLRIFNYFVFESDFYNKDIPSSVFAFGAKIYNDLHSITGRLYSSYDIERLQFGFTFNSKTEEDKGTLFIGGLSKENILQYNTSIKAQDNTPQWTVDMNYIVIENLIYKTKKYDTSFSTTTPYIILPKEINDDIINQYLERYIKKFQCKRYGYTTREYDCDCSVLKELPSIGFIIDNNYLTLKAEELFFRYENRCVYNIIPNEDIYDVKENQIVLGIHFLWNYNSLFDKDEKRITLFLNETFPDINIVYTLMNHSHMSIVYNYRLNNFDWDYKYDR